MLEIMGVIMKMDIRNNEKVMKEKCLCEGCNSKEILKHFEKCTVCRSVAYHSTPRVLNAEEEN